MFPPLIFPHLVNSTQRREDMKKILEDHRVLKGYVDFIGAQYHKAIDHQEQGHDKQVNHNAAVGAIRCESTREDTAGVFLATIKMN